MFLFYIVTLYERYRENWKRPNTFVHYLYILITINIDNKLNKRLTWVCFTHRFIIQWLFITWFVVSKILLLLGNPGYGNTNVDTTTRKVASDSGVGPFKYSTHPQGCTRRNWVVPPLWRMSRLFHIRQLT